MRAARRGWVSIPEILAGLPKNYPELAARLAGKPRKRQLEAVRRLVYRAERRDSERYTKRVDGDIFVRVDSVESLLPADVAKLGEVVESIQNLHQSQRGLQRQVNGYGAKLRDHEKRIATNEEITRHLGEAQAALAKAAALQARG